MLRVLPRDGYAAVTIGHLTREAGVSRAAFYQQFASKEDCFLATYEIASQWFCERVEAAVAEAEDWRERIRAGAAETLAPARRQPAGGAPDGGRDPARRADGAPAPAGDAGSLRGGLSAGHPGRAELPDDLGTLLLGGAVALIARYVDTGRAERCRRRRRRWSSTC